LSWQNWLNSPGDVPPVSSCGDWVLVPDAPPAPVPPVCWGVVWVAVPVAVPPLAAPEDGVVLVDVLVEVDVSLVDVRLAPVRASAPEGGVSSGVEAGTRSP
jgi:hypothetical protein